MLPILEKVEANINQSFHVNHMKVEHFPSPLHFHPEVEILLVVQGTGTRFLGDSVERYAPGDLVMIGSNVPHVWYSDKFPSQNGNGTISEAIYILFNTEVFGEHFWDLPESRSLKKIIRYSQRGIKLSGKTRDDVSLLMNSIATSVGFSRISLLFSILEIVASTKEYKYLASSVLQNTISQSDSDRLNKVYKYVMDNSWRGISLDEAASVANFSTPAFCRYFKKRTNKTFVRFLNEIRVGHACRLLADENHSISDIGFICGFNNISYFIKQFKKTTGFTPLNYRKKFAD